MSKVSVIIPARNEIFLQNTIDDILKNAKGDVEIIAVLDGYWPNPPLKEFDNLTTIHFGKSRGMRAAINSAASIANGEWLMKADAHCSFSEGFDEILKSDCADNWIMIPRRYSLDAENWKIDDNGKPPRDYHYLCYPNPDKDHDGGMHGVEWYQRGKERNLPEYDIDDTMSWQGSMWFMNKKHWDWLGGMNEYGYGTFSQEPQEIGNKTWLGGGALKVNKRCWYAHLHKGKQYGRMYSISKSGIVTGHNYSAWYWMNNIWEKRIYDIEWLIEKFWPVPTWPENWIEAITNWRKEVDYGFGKVVQ